jgi:integrase
MKFPTKEQVEKFFSVVKLSRDRAIFAKILEFGSRGQECSLLDLDDVDWETGTVAFTD